MVDPPPSSETAHPSEDVAASSKTSVSLPVLVRVCV
jgi:hypothetical protein